MLAVGVVLLIAPPAEAERRTPTQEEPPNTSSTTSTTAPGPTSTTSTTRPSPGTSSTTTTTISPVDPGAGGDVTGGRAPDGVVEVPPPDDGDGGPHRPSIAIVGDLSSARERLAEAETRVADAQARVIGLQDRLTEIEARILALDDDERQAVKRVEESQVVLTNRAVNAYVRGNQGGLEATWSAGDPNQASVNAAMMESVLAADAQAVADHRRARREVSAELVDLADERVTVLGDLVQAKHYDKAVRGDVLDAEVQLAAFEAGSEIFVTGMVFPVDDPHNYIDSWEFPRSGGRRHQGVDIFAPIGTYLFAAERGVVANLGSNSLGGTKLWIYGESGTTYYYAHLSGFAPGVRNGLLVDAGDLVGYVGNTGNARTTPPHLHFEIHPDNGPAVNPTPLLQVIDALDGGEDPGTL